MEIVVCQCIKKLSKTWGNFWGDLLIRHKNFLQTFVESFKGFFKFFRKFTRLVWKKCLFDGRFFKSSFDISCNGKFSLSLMILYWPAALSFMSFFISCFFFVCAMLLLVLTFSTKQSFTVFQNILLSVRSFIFSLLEHFHLVLLNTICILVFLIEFTQFPRGFIFY